MIIQQPNTNLIINADNLTVLKELPDNSVDSIVTDPPYGLSFMGKKWDYDVPEVNLWYECLRVLKHGAYLLSFAGTRTYHRMAVNIEDAGFEIRDMISWLYGSGFPKSLNIGKQIDKIQGNEREITGFSKNEKDFRDVGKKVKEEIGINKLSFGTIENAERKDLEITKGTSAWEGWGTALKPACEPIVVARKPLSEKNVALNVLKWGTGGINIDECRIDYKSNKDMEGARYGSRGISHADHNWGMKELGKNILSSTQGRFPANIILDEEAGKILDEQTGNIGCSSNREKYKGSNYGTSMFLGDKPLFNSPTYTDKGGASRFFYCAKSSKAERNNGITTTTIKLIKPQNIDILWKEENMELAQLILKDILGLTESLNIEESGENIMVMCQKECLSTIKMEINKITELKTWNSLTHLLTKDYIQDVLLKMEDGSNHVEFVKNLKKLMMKTGISQEKVGLLLEDVKNAIYQMLLVLKEKEEDWQEDKCGHPTVKPLKLMQYLVRLVTPKGGVCLDPFLGSGTTAIACVKEGMNYIGIEREEDYIKIANARIKAVEDENESH